MSSYVPQLSASGGINSSVEAAEYAVRGAIVSRAQTLDASLRAGERLPFDRVVFCNIGNPQSLQQKPLTFLRQALSAAVNPSLLDAGVLPTDVVDRVRGILSECDGVGAYSHSKGIPSIRQRVAASIERRDGGVKCDPESLYLTNGASEGAKVLVQMLVRSPTDGVLVPVPQYPLYSAAMTLSGGRRVDYFLDEDAGWGLDVGELDRALKEAREDGTDVRAIVVINPGNPTGNTLTRSNMEALVRFCERERLVILADEVYQANVYVDSKPFVSFKQVVSELESPVELASFHSVSKGFTGECGLRGGFLETHNMTPHANGVIYKMMSVSLCANVPGQIAVDLMMTPPSPGDESYDVYHSESSAIYDSLKRRAQRLSKALDGLEGIDCSPAEGAMYAFPKIRLPPAAIADAEAKGYKCADVFYCMRLLEETGVCVVPGSGFGQKEGTLHFRTTILPPEEDMEGVVEKIRVFHDKFLREYTSHHL